MANSIMYQEDGYVVLESNQPEKLMTKEELLTKFTELLNHNQNNLPLDIQKISSVEKQATYLLESYCEFEIGEGEYLQWYVTRWEK